MPVSTIQFPKDDDEEDKFIREMEDFRREMERAKREWEKMMKTKMKVKRVPWIWKDNRGG